MRAAFITSEVLRAEEDPSAALDALHKAGLEPVVLMPRPEADGGKLKTGGYPTVACRTDDEDCWGEEPTLILEAASRSGATPSEAFMVCRSTEDLKQATAAGCRPVLVLNGRTLAEVYGPVEPPYKATICADDLETATQFMLDETDLHERLGAFPYAPGSTLDERVRTRAPSRRDITRLLVIITLAGLTLALGVAYFLKEVYQVYQFPSIVHYLTLQFVPRTVRGALFLAIGAIFAYLAWLSVDRLPPRRTAD